MSKDVMAGDREGAAGSGAPPFKLRYASHLGIRSIEQPLFAATVGSSDPVAHIDYAASQGFAGIEDNFLKDRTIEDQKRIGEALAGHGMEMGCFTIGIDFERPSWGRSDEESRQRIDADIANAIEVAKRVNGKYVVIAATRDLRVPEAYQRAAMVRHLRRLAPIAERAGIVLCLEQTSETRLPGMILHNMPEAFAVANAVDSPAVKLLFDFYHVQMMDGQVLGHLDQAWDEVAIVQVAEPPNRGELGDGELNWVTILRALVARGYTGLIEYEIFPTLPGVEGERKALEALRAIDAAV